MKEINFKESSNEEKPKEPSMVNKVDEIYSALKDVKKKKIRIPRKAKVKKSKIKKGYIGVIKIDENGHITGEKQKVRGGCFSTDKGTQYHAHDGREVLFWEGKYPVIIQPVWRKNPINVRDLVTEIEKDGKKLFVSNETYGQQYIKARMLADVIKVKNKGGFSALFWLIGLAIAGYLVYAFLTGGI